MRHTNITEIAESTCRFLKIVLSLKPAKMLLAKGQLQSRFSTAITRTEHYTLFNNLYNEGKKLEYTHAEQRNQE